MPRFRFGNIHSPGGAFCQDCGGIVPPLHCHRHFAVALEDNSWSSNLSATNWISHIS
jgi:hypothetical protein